MKPHQEQEEDEERLRQRKLEESLEIKSLRRIISAYLNYPEAAEEDVKRYERSFRKLPPSHKAFEPPLDMSQDIDDCGELHFERPPDDGNVCSHESTTARGSCSKLDEACCGEPSNVMSKLEEGLTANEEVQIEGCHGSDPGSCLAGEENNKRAAECCGNHVSDSNGNVLSSPRDWLDPSFQLHVPLVDVDKGQKERDQCYKPILEELNSLFPSRCNKSPPTCLVPGAGLGRLALEISCLGIAEGFSMCGGDFVEVYSDPSQVGVWDAVVTCFFIDTAHNIVEYIEIISRILKDGGKEKTIETTYATNPRSMMQNRYFAAFWTMRKKSAAAEKVST
ncbi:carnosine N-methyltransferase-like isoform X6 [Populus alba x Populus x berolinensis]|nr:carnosine N-methyltransferase-like isoform X6 [Populus alba x Populus x berolinensis]